MVPANVALFSMSNAEKAMNVVRLSGGREGEWNCLIMRPLGDTIDDTGNHGWTESEPI